MTHQYESEVLNKLMERDGLNIPSSVPPYESEIKAYLINQVKPSYPKLTDYEAEWLLYNYTEHLPAEFPISSVINATSATFENVVPFAYQSAILKGQTLMNNLQKITLPKKYDTITNLDIRIRIKIKQGEAYYAYVDITVPETDRKLIGFIGSNAWQSDAYPLKSGFNKIKLIANSDLIEYLRIQVDNGTTIRSVVLMKEDVEFTNQIWGMQSAKMPVLTITGKNLFNKNNIIVDGYIISNGNLVYQTGDNRNATDYIEVESNCSYTLSGIKNSAINGAKTHQYIGMYDKNKKHISTATIYCPRDKETITTVENTKYIRLSVRNDDINRLQIEKGTTPTTYEPHKSNILTVNEDVTLRGIGDVQDTLDCLTGKLTQRIEEVVLDGSNDEGWVVNGDRNKAISMLSKNISASLNATGIICADFVTSKDTTSNDIELIRLSTSSGKIIINILKSRLGLASDITDEEVLIKSFNEWLSQNPLTVQYQLKTESVKTVELTTVNEKGETTYLRPFEGTMNVQSSGEIIQPTFDMSVPVEATSHNLATFIDLEMEE